MAQQASGGKGQFLYAEETTWGTPPGGNWKKLAAAIHQDSLDGTIEELTSKAINPNRVLENARGGVKAVGGSLGFEMPITGLGTLLKHALGKITTTGTGPYTHVIKRDSLPVGLSIEKGLTDIGQYFVFAGCRIDKLSLSLDAKGMVTGSLDVLGKSVTRAEASAGGTPAALAHVPVVSHEAAVVELGNVAAQVVGMDLNMTNNLDGDVYILGSRERGGLPEGRGECSGNLSLMFRDDNAASIFDTWNNETETSIKVRYVDGNGNYVQIWLPRIKFFGGLIPKLATEKGIILPVPFRALKDATELSDLVIEIQNGEAAL